MNDLKSNAESMNREGVESQGSASTEQSIFLPKGVYKNPAGSEFPIIAYDDIYRCFSDHLTCDDDEKGPKIAAAFSRETNEGIYQKMRDCGFNVDLLVVKEVGMADKIDEVIGIMQDNGLSLIMDLHPYYLKVVSIDVSYENDTIESVNRVNWGYKDSFLECLNKSTKYQNIKGVLIYDEPSYTQWTGSLKEIWDSRNVKTNPNEVWLPLQTYYAAVSAAPNLITYMNLACDVRQKDIVGTNIFIKSAPYKEKYQRYLTEFFATFPQTVISFDLYPIFQNVGQNDSECRVKNEYYLYLEAIAEFASMHDLPIWNVIQSKQHEIGNVSYPLPTEGMLRFHVFNAIAHGAKGVAYWRYSCGVGEDDADNKGSALLNVTLNSDDSSISPMPKFKYTDAWDAAKIVNKDLAKWGKMLLGTKYLDAVHVYGSNSAPRYRETKEFSKSFVCITGVTVSGEGCVMTHLEGENTSFIVIVNHSFEESQTINLTLSKDYTYILYSSVIDEDNEDSSEIVNKSMAALAIETFKRKINLAAGDMWLLEFKKK